MRVNGSPSTGRALCVAIPLLITVFTVFPGNDMPGREAVSTLPPTTPRPPTAPTRNRTSTRRRRTPPVQSVRAGPFIPPVLGVAKAAPDADAWRHVVPSCPLTLVTSGDRFNGVEDEIKLRGWVATSSDIRNRIVFNSGKMSATLRSWLATRNVVVVDFDGKDTYAELWAREGTTEKRGKALGGYMSRYDISRILMAQFERFARPTSPCDRFVLYADVDIFFSLPLISNASAVAATSNSKSSVDRFDEELVKAHHGEFILDAMVDQLPFFIAATTEWTGGWPVGLERTDGKRVDANTGLIVINVPSFAAVALPFQRYTVARAAEGKDNDVLDNTHDQAAFNLFFGGTTAGIVSKLYNWRLLNGLNGRARVHHYIGVKCESLLCDPPNAPSKPTSVALDRVGVQLNCADVKGSSWRKFSDSFFAQRAPGGPSNVFCGYEVVCRRALQLAPIPYQCGAFVNRESPDLTGRGFGTAVNTQQCKQDPVTCSLFGKSESCSESNTKSLVPAVLRVSLQQGKECAVAVVVVLRRADNVASVVASVRSAKAAGVQVVIIVSIDVAEAAKLLAEVMTASSSTGNGGVFLVETTGTDDWAGDVDHAGVVPLQVASVLFAKAPTALFNTWLRQPRKAQDSLTCPSPLALLVEAGARFKKVPRLDGDGVWPVLGALRRRCDDSVVWSLGASTCAIDAMPSDRMVLLNMLGMLGATEAARRVATTVTVPNGSDRFTHFAGNLVTALPDGWGTSSSTSPESTVDLPDDGTCSAQASSSTWPSQSLTVKTSCSRSAFCKANGKHAACDVAHRCG